MRRLALIASIVAYIAATDAVTAFAAEKPADRVVALYFHRTERCPTCQKMGSYAEEAVKQGFTEQVKKGTVEFHYIDFQDDKNATLKKAYRISGPALVVAQVIDNKVKQFKNLEEIWTKVQKKDEFLRYVRDNLAAYRK
jgi:thiol-disulfide isomerase/thioredoxin